MLLIALRVINHPDVIWDLKVVFEGMTFEKISDNEMNIYVDIHNDNGTVDTVKFNYTKD